jgi:hypothetical protein
LTNEVEELMDAQKASCNITEVEKDKMIMTQVLLESQFGNKGNSSQGGVTS